jgi:thymidylate kinase
MRPLIVLEGLDGSGKSVRGRTLSSALGIPFIEFPLEKTRSLAGSHCYQIECHNDRVWAVTHMTTPFIAGRWSPSGIAYSLDRCAARDREDRIPPGLLEVYVNTPPDVRLRRLQERTATDDFEIPQMQEYAEDGYHELIDYKDWSPLIVGGVDVEQDVAIILEALEELRKRGEHKM